MTGKPTARTLTNRDERDRGAKSRAPVPHLVRVLDYEQPRMAGSRHRLDGIDEVVIGRATEHEVKRTKRTLALGIGDARMS